MKKILLIISGSIAAVKSHDLIRRLRDNGHEVTCVLTHSGEKFVTPLSLSSLSGNKTYTNMFSLDDEVEMGHIQLSRAADLVLVAPASANILAKMGNGLCDDLASTLLLATDKQVMVAPAMNVRMWEHPATVRNVKQIRKDGIRVITPGKGKLACGEEGEGRMAEPEQIVSIIEAYFEGLPEGLPLKGKKALVTSGPTVEAIDPVRYIANRSSGKQGYAIAEMLASFGAEVTLVSGPTQLTKPAGVKFVQVESAREMLDSCMKMLPVDIAVCAAAVADWRASEFSDEKIKKGDDDQTFTFMENPDILECISHDSRRPELVIGFAAETGDLEKNAVEKRDRKGCDWILANDVSGGKIFGEDETNIHFVTGEAPEDWGTMSKRKTAHTLANKIGEYFEEQKVVSLKRKAYDKRN
jgi:phosphopantothenoylcysteine decarboxylase/phosphopantothenate--cysteine ligase